MTSKCKSHKKSESRERKESKKEEMIENLKGAHLTLSKICKKVK